MLRRFDRCRRVLLLGSLLLPLTLSALFAQGQDTDREGRREQELTRIKDDPLKLEMFFREMPKGADLHNHLSGAIYAESMIEWAAESNLCIDINTLTATDCSGTAAEVKATAVLANPVIYRRVVDAWSTRNWELSGESGHDDFFDTFGKFGATNDNRTGDMLAEAARNAARDRVSYLELMFTADGSSVAALGSRVGWNDDFATMRKQLLERGLRDTLRATLARVNIAEAKMREVLECDGSSTDGLERTDPCSVRLRYLYQVLRGIAPEQVFAQILTGFELAEMDPRFVGFNLVMPEDYAVPLRDFDLQMRIIDYLRPMYQKAHITLHAGELAPGLVPPDELCCHIRKSVTLGHAERIGHGVDIAYEDDTEGTLAIMRERNVMVEVCLTSNDVILGIRGKHHPLHLYKEHGIPMALATDDEGVSRIDLTHEFVKAVLEQDLGYRDLKRMVRNSLEYSFLPGESLWNSPEMNAMKEPCARSRPGTSLSDDCRSWLELNEKASMQWKLEEDFRRFE